MWEDKYKSTRRMKLIIAVLIVIIGAALCYAVVYTQNKTKLEDEKLLQVYDSQQKEQADNKQQSVKMIEEEYQKDMDCLSTYLPGIVCWGDSLITGSSGNVSIPSVLYKYIQANIIDVYDFKSSISNASEFSYLDWNSYKIDIPVINMGGGDENSYTVLGRCGAEPFVVSHETVIPADTEPVRIRFQSASHHPVAPLKNGDAGVNNVTIAGIEGTLTLEHTQSLWSSDDKYYFTRSVPGTETTVEAETPIITSGTDMYKNYLHVICIGNYGQFSSTDQLISQIKTLIARQEINPDRYLVLGFCCQNGQWLNLEYIDASLQIAFGNRYINIRSYLCSDGVNDAKVTLSSGDKLNVSAGIVPECFRNTSGNSQLNMTAYKLIGKLVYDRMDSLGYFDEIRSELYIDEVVKQLLKDNPTYLNNLLENRMKEIGS